METDYKGRIGNLIRDARKHRGLTQTQLAEVLGTSQSAVHRIEAGNQNLSLEMVNRIAAALDAPLISVGQTAPQHLRVQGGVKLNGAIDVRSSSIRSRKRERRSVSPSRTASTTFATSRSQARSRASSPADSSRSATCSDRRPPQMLRSVVTGSAR